MWNPSFDVTPSNLITGIITEKGLVPKRASGGFDVAVVVLNNKVLQANGTKEHSENGHVSSIQGFYALDLETVKDYLAERPELCKKLGTPQSQSQWMVSGLR